MASNSRRPIPDLSHVDGTLRGAELSGEPLVPISHRRVTLLHTYRNDGWREATDRCVLRQSAAEALVHAAVSLPSGWGIAVHDAWRPQRLQVALYQEAYAVGALANGYVEVPSEDHDTPAPHVTGGAVDVTLTYRGAVLALGTEFDDFTSDAHLRAFEGSAGWVQEARRELYWAMTEAGFVAIPHEWWHFEIHTRRWAASTANAGAPLYGAVHSLLGAVS